MAAVRPVPRVLTRPVLWGLVLVALAGIVTYACLSIPVEVLPQFSFPQVSVTTHLPGTTATELQTLLVYPLEGQILTLPDLASVRAVMGHGFVQIDVRFRQGTSAALDLQAVNGAIDRARGELPPAAHPLAQIMGNAINEVADYTAQIPVDVPPAQVQRAVLTSVAPALRALPGVQFVNVYGAGDESLWIQPDLAALRRYGVSVVAIAAAVKSEVLLAPAGYTTQGHNDILIEARHLPAHIAQLGATPVRGPNGPIPLRDLARIVRAAVPTHNAVALDGRPSVALTIVKQPGMATTPVTHAVASVLRQTSRELPHGVRWVRIYDQGSVVHLVGTDLGRNLLIGMALAVAVLFWVLGGGRGIWVLACSIPLSLATAIAALYFCGQDLNLMTLGALTVAVGLLADDAIIVLESIYHCWDEGDGHREGIRRGLRSILIPDITGTLTNVAIYVPLLFVGGLVGLFFIPFSMAMTFALLASLIVSISLIPLGLSFAGARRDRTATGGGQRLLERLRRWNERLFDLVARTPRLSLGVTFGVLIASLIGLLLVPIDFLPLPNEGVLLESFALPPGSSLLDSRLAAEEISRRLLADRAVAHVYARVGSAQSTAYAEPASAGEMMVALRPGVSVNALDRIGRRIRQESHLAGVQLAIGTPTLERLGESLSGLPQPFVIHVFGSDVAETRRLAEQITARLRPIPALSNIFDNGGYPVTQLRIEPRAAALAAYGLTSAGLYAQLDALLNGEVLARIPQGNVPLDLYIRLADAPQRSLAELANLPIRTQGWTPLGQLARLDLLATPNQLEHIAGAPALDILATPTGALGGTVAAARRALAGLRLPPGYRITFGGLYPELRRAFAGVAIAAVAACVLMLGILLLQFDGLLVPGILLLEIPLAVTGGTVALIVSGVGLNATGLIGFLTLIGIGLRHSIVLFDRARRNEEAGMQPEPAVREAIRVRFRPIVLTAATAILGMLPTAMGFGQGAAPEQGLAIVILGGLAWSAIRSTNLIPALYLYWRQRQLARQGTG